MGGLPELSGNDLLVAEAEWAELSKLAPEARGFLRNHIQLPGLTWHQISLEPTTDPALEPFTQSLDIMGDLLQRRQLPGVGSRRQLASTTNQVLALRQRMPDLAILPAHDPTAAQRLLDS
jgi:N-acyl homoserine lactone hydrolase